MRVKKGDGPTELQLPKEIHIPFKCQVFGFLNFNAEFFKNGLDVSLKTTLRLQKNTTVGTACIS